MQRHLANGGATDLQRHLANGGATDLQRHHANDGAAYLQRHLLNVGAVYLKTALTDSGLHQFNTWLNRAEQLPFLRIKYTTCLQNSAIALHNNKVKKFGDKPFLRPN